MSEKLAGQAFQFYSADPVYYCDFSNNTRTVLLVVCISVSVSGHKHVMHIVVFERELGGA